MDKEEAISEIESCVAEGLQLLRRAADILRGPDVEASARSMQVEICVTRAIESLSRTKLR